MDKIGGMGSIQEEKGDKAKDVFWGTPDRGALKGPKKGGY